MKGQTGLADLAVLVGLSEDNFYGEEKQSMAFGIPQMQIGWGGNMKFTAFGFMQISLIELLWSALVMLVR